MPPKKEPKESNNTMGSSKKRRRSRSRTKSKSNSDASKTNPPKEKSFKEKPKNLQSETLDLNTTKRNEEESAAAAAPNGGGASGPSKQQAAQHRAEARRMEKAHHENEAKNAHMDTIEDVERRLKKKYKKLKEVYTNSKWLTHFNKYIQGKHDHTQVNTPSKIVFFLHTTKDTTHIFFFHLLFILTSTGTTESRCQIILHRNNIS